MKIRERQDDQNIHGYAIPPDMRVYAVGDAQGHVDAQKVMHDKINRDIADHPIPRVDFILKGDGVAKGLYSAQLVDLFMQGSSHPIINPYGETRVTFQAGNHDLAFARALRDVFAQESDPEQSALLHYLWEKGEKHYNKKTTTFLSYAPYVDLPRRYGDLVREIPNLRVAFKDAVQQKPGHYEFFQNMTLSQKIGDYFFVHAGIRPGVVLENQTEEDLMNIREPYIDYEGDFGFRVVSGHTPRKDNRVLFAPNKIITDLGSYDTGWIGGVVLEGTEAYEIRGYAPPLPLPKIITHLSHL